MTKEAPTWLAGVDGCKGGWIAVFYRYGERHAAEAAVFADFAGLFADPRSTGTIAIDMPIGLPTIGQPGGRTAEHAVRALIGPRRSSVFGIPARAAVEAHEKEYAEVCAIAARTSQPSRRPSIQAYHIFPRIMALDVLLRGDAGLAARVFEVHPELSFRAMKEAPLAHSKKRGGRPFGAGMSERRDLLLAQGYVADFLDGRLLRGVGCDDFFDACAAAWSAARIFAGTAWILPNDVPEFDAFGLPMRICG